MKIFFKRTCLTLVLSMFLLTSMMLAASPSEGGAESARDVTHFAGNGEFTLENGAVDIAAFRSPERITIGPDGAVYVSDTLNHVIRQIKNGQVTSFSGITLTTDEAGNPEGAFIDGTAEGSLYNHPKGIAIGPDGHLYVADTHNHAIRKVDANGTVTTIAGSGELGDADGKGESAQFYGPEGLAVASDGTIYVADTLNHVIRRIDSDGEVSTLNAPSDRLVELLPGLVEQAGDFKDGALSEAKFNEPTAIAIDRKGNLYVSDKGNHVIRYIDLKTEQVTTVAGQKPNYDSDKLYAAGGYKDGQALQARFHSPQGIALTENGGLVIADRLNHVIRYLNEGRVTTLVGSGGAGQSNGFYSPSDVAVTREGTVIIVDSYHNQLRQFSLHQKTFTDVQDHWAEASIQRAVQLGMIEGYPDKSFQPDASINRIEFTAMLVRALNLEGDGAELHFTDDIPKWSEQELSLALEHDLITGYVDGSFRPNQSIDRAEMTAMMMRAMDIEGSSNVATSFADDASIPDWARGYVAEAVKEGIMQGRTENRFAPNENGTRAEATVMLLRMVDKQ